MIRSKYEDPTFARVLTDFPINGMNQAILPAKEGINNLEGYTNVGNIHGKVVELASGLQMLTALPNEVVEMRLFGSGGNDWGQAQHLTYLNGKPDRSTPVTLDRNCLGSHVDVDCGCNDHTHAAIDKAFASKDSAAYINIDQFTSPSATIEIARNIMEALGVDQSSFVTTTPGFEHGCSFSEQLEREKQLHGVFKGAYGQIYLFTHDFKVSFHGGYPGRLLVIEEPGKEDKKGYTGRPRRHQVLVYGDVHDPRKPPVVRYHSSCITSELGGNGCDCETQQARTFQAIADNGSGIFMLADEEGMGSGLINKLWQTQETAMNEADLLTSRESHLDMPGDVRNYDLIGVVKSITGVNRALHASNNHLKAEALEQNGIEIVGHVALPVDGLKFASQADRDFIAKQKSGRYKQYSNSS